MTEVQAAVFCLVAAYGQAERNVLTAQVASMSAHKYRHGEIPRAFQALKKEGVIDDTFHTPDVLGRHSGESLFLTLRGVALARRYGIHTPLDRAPA